MLLSTVVDGSEHGVMLVIADCGAGCDILCRDW